MCCISYDVQWLEREESQYDMKLLSALFHIHDEALVEKNNKMMALSVINLQESLIKKMSMTTSFKLLGDAGT